MVRLQGGDPAIFGRAGEEIAALASAGIEWEIVPGITSASAAAAAAGISLTDRHAAGNLSLSLAIATGAGCGRRKFLRRLLGGATVAVYMPSSSYVEIAREFMDSGWDSETPCIIVSEASSRDNVLCDQQSVRWANVGGCPRLRY